MGLTTILNFLKSHTPDIVSIASGKQLAAAENYTAEDVLSEHITLGTSFIFPGVVKENGGSGEIQKALAFCSETALTPRITLYLFSDIPTSVLNDNVANTAVSAANHPNFEGQLDFLAMEDLGGGSTSVITMGTYGNLPLVFKCRNRALYGIAVTRDAITAEIAGMILSFKLQIRRD